MMMFRLGALLFVIVSIFLSSIIRRLETVTDAASRIIEFTLTGCITPSLCSYRSLHIAPIKIPAAIIHLHVISPSPPVDCLCYSVCCFRLNNRTSQLPKGRSAGKERAQIKKWCKLAKGVKKPRKINGTRTRVGCNKTLKPLHPGQ
jgi:hypothetical protein